MARDLFDFALNIPQTLGAFGTWLTSPLDPTYLNLSPIELLGIGGVATIIAIIVVHIVRLFI